ncbi:MAG: hypothetical protein AB7V27_11305 [Candidatus Binatia bacterium]
MKNIDRGGRFANERGVSLIETVVALGLFALSAATMGEFLVTHIRHASNNHLQTQAYALAEEQLEATRALRYNDMVPSTKTVTVSNVAYKIVTTIDADVPADGLKTIHVDVSWKDPQGPRNVSLHTIYTEVRRF